MPTKKPKWRPTQDMFKLLISFPPILITARDGIIGSLLPCTSGELTIKAKTLDLCLTQK